MFSASVQPSVVSLFSSTGSDPLALFSSHCDTSLPSDSFVCILNDSTSEPAPPAPHTLIKVKADDDDDDESPDYALGQSPSSATQSRRAPEHLGLKHPWMHLQVRNLHREWAFEVGLVDQSGREGIVRCATFQKEPRLKLGRSPMLLLPLSFPPPSSHPLTSWCTIAIHLPSLLPHFSSAALTRNDEEEVSSPAGPSQYQYRTTQVPSGTYSHVSYVKVYATCRLRRVWFSEGGPQQRLPWEFQLYAAE
ncbi:hypothetical protein C8Q73DRAFT_280773 [Cubamyces lactineus]|nr:hypothetical protein C8Q73DRAFT_280773 [Cubamyces lactineus]